MSKSEFICTDTSFKAMKIDLKRSKLSNTRVILLVSLCCDLTSPPITISRNQNKTNLISLLFFRWCNLVRSKALTTIELIRLGTYVIAPYVHFRHSINARHLQLDSVLLLANIHIRGHFATFQINRVGWRGSMHHFLPAFVQIQMEVLAREPVLLERFQCKPLRPAEKI